MSRKTPGIHERNGRIRISFDLGLDPVTGTRRQRFETLPRGTTKQEARIIRARKIAEIADGIRPDPKKMTLGEFLEDWIERFRLEHPETRTWYSWRSYLRKHLLPLIGSVRLARLDTGTIATAYRRIPPKMVRYVHAALHRGLEDAVTQGLIAKNWAHGAWKPVKPDMARGATNNCWSEKELAAFLAAARFDDLGYATWRTLAATGLRMGELLGLAPGDVDIDAATVTVRQQYSLAGSKPSLRAPKTGPSRRVIDIDPATVTALRGHLRRQGERQKELRAAGVAWKPGFLFTRDDGSPIHPRSFQNRFAKLVERASVREITPHGVRHTHATILLRQGRSIAYVASRLGHTPEVLLRVYAHILEQDGAEAARGFADAIDSDVARLLPGASG